MIALPIIGLYLLVAVSTYRGVRADRDGGSWTLGDRLACIAVSAVWPLVVFYALLRLLRRKVAAVNLDREVTW